MQWPPPRPRPSSWPAIASTSTPALASFALVASLRSYATTTPGSERDDVVAVVPLVALGLELVAAGRDELQVRDPERVPHLVEERALRDLGLDAAVAAGPEEDRQDLLDTTGS